MVQVHILLGGIKSVKGPMHPPCPSMPSNLTFGGVYVPVPCTILARIAHINCHKLVMVHGTGTYTPRRHQKCQGTHAPSMPLHALQLNLWGCICTCTMYHTS